MQGYVENRHLKLFELPEFCFELGSINILRIFCIFLLSKLQIQKLHLPNFRIICLGLQLNLDRESVFVVVFVVFS